MFNEKSLAVSPFAPTTPSASDDQFDVGEATAIVRSTGLAPWARYIPGPSPQHCFDIPPALSQPGIILIGCLIFLISGHSEIIASRIKVYTD